jgi:hypothetical protein
MPSIPNLIITPGVQLGSFREGLGLCAQTQKYRNPPSPVTLTPNHHQRSALTQVFDCSPGAFGNNRKLRLTLLVAAAAPVEVVGGCNVVVGSICGGLYAIYMGAKGEPSNW